jgi:hypothetical protein
MSGHPVATSRARALAALLLHNEGYPLSAIAQALRLSNEGAAWKALQRGFRDPLIAQLASYQPGGPRRSDEALGLRPPPDAATLALLQQMREAQRQQSAPALAMLAALSSQGPSARGGFPRRQAGRRPAVAAPSARRPS